MAQYNLYISSIPLGGTAFANIATTDNGALEDVDSIQATFKDNLGVTLVDMTRTTVDISTTDIYGNAATLADPMGTGNYYASLVIDENNYSPPVGGLTWTLTIKITKGSDQRTEVFPFTIVPTTLDISIDSLNLASCIKRQVGLLKDISAFGGAATQNGTYLSIGEEIVYGIDAAYKNGAQFIQGGSGDTYEWKLFRPYVKLNTSAVSTDHFLFRIQRRISDNVLQDYITEAENHVTSRLSGHYEPSQIATSSTAFTLMCDRAIGRLRKELSEGPAQDAAHYRAGKELLMEVDEVIMGIQRGEINLLSQDNEAITRKPNSVIGTFKSPAGPVTNRLQLIDRTQQYTSIVIGFPYELQLTSSPRGL